MGVPIDPTALAPDYTEQLEAIAAALNRPTTPSYVIPVVCSVLSAILGMFGGVFVQIYSRGFSDWVQRDRIKNALYRDLGDAFLFVWNLLSDKPYPTNPRLQSQWEDQQCNKHIKFSVEEFLKKQPDIYAQLPEQYAADDLYAWLHHIVNKDKTGSASNPAMFCQIFSEYVESGELKEKSLQKACGKDKLSKIMENVRIARERVKMVEKAVAEGRSNVVDGFEEEHGEN